VLGTFADTGADDGVAQSVTEVESGGKPSNRRSQLEHTWLVHVVGGGTTTLVANVWSGGSTDNDEFLFVYSTDGGASWTSAFIVGSLNPDNLRSAPLPFGTSGAVRVRVTDTDRTQGNVALNTVFIDMLAIEVENGAGSPPAAPTSLSAVAVAPGRIDLGWSDASDDEAGFEIERFQSGGPDWALIAILGVEAGDYADSSVVPNTGYQYRVRAFNGSGASDWSNTAAATTPNGISLAGSGYKVKGVISVDLAWSNVPAGNLEIFRNGALVATVPASAGAYTDDTGQKGSATFLYRVCAEGDPGSCSNEVTVVF
jgi:hypothetical protein